MKLNILLKEFNDSKGKTIDLGWYILTYGKKPKKIKIIKVDGAGITYQTPSEKGRFTIPASMIDRKKIGAYLTKL